MPYRTSKITKRTVTFTVFVYNSANETSKIANVISLIEPLHAKT